MKHQRNHPHFINDSIPAQQVLLLDPDKKPLGVKPFKEALLMARNMGLDLVLIAPKAAPPVCLIEDYGKFLYQHNKENHHQKAARSKEIQLSANIFEHDLETKVRQAKEFLVDGHPVKVVLKLRGREKAHPDLGRQQIQRFLNKVCGAAIPFIQQQGGAFNAFIRV